MPKELDYARESNKCIMLLIKGISYRRNVQLKDFCVFCAEIYVCLLKNKHYSIPHLSGFGVFSAILTLL